MGRINSTTQLNGIARESNSYFKRGSAYALQPFHKLKCVIYK